MPKIQLEMRSGNKILKSWPLLPNNEYTIGRSQNSANIVIELSSLSRSHCKLSVSESGSVVVQDLGSKNGTFIDGKKISSNQIVLLRVGSEMTLGENDEKFAISESRERSRSREEEYVEKKAKKLEKVVEKSEAKKGLFKKEEKEQSKVNIKMKKSLLWGNSNQKHSSNLSNISLQSLDANMSEKIKFLKLMGVKSNENIQELLPEKAVGDEQTQQGVKSMIDKVEHMKEDLEKQFNQGMQRKDGRKVGLGFNN